MALIESRHTARLIITLNCRRRCTYCCNQYKAILSKAIHIDAISQLTGYRVVCITGGEPMLKPEQTLGIIRLLQQLKPRPSIYLYTALFDPRLPALIADIDGIHCTLHESSSAEDIAAFQQFQEALRCWPNKSFRLYVHPGIHQAVLIYPYLWKRVEVKPWITEEEARLPVHETLFLLRHAD